MSLSFAIAASDNILGNRRATYTDVTLDAYLKGGRSITPANVRLASIESLRPCCGNAASAKYRYHWDKVNQKLVVAAGGDKNVNYAVADAKGATNPAGTEGNADQASAPVNSVLLMAATAVSVLAGTMTPTVQPDVPRNVMITVLNDTGGNLNLYQGTTTFTITGTDVNGAAQTETVTLTSTSGNKAVAHAPDYRYVQGVKAFATVTSVTYDNAPASTMKMSLGVGTRIGLPKALANAAVADVLELTVSAAAVTPSSTTTAAGGVDTTNNTINTDTTADNWDLAVTYKETGEVTAGTDLSSVVVTLEAVGY